MSTVIHDGDSTYMCVRRQLTGVHGVCDASIKTHRHIQCSLSSWMAVYLAVVNCFTRDLGACPWPDLSGRPISALPLGGCSQNDSLPLPEMCSKKPKYSRHPVSECSWCRIGAMFRPCMQRWTSYGPSRSRSFRVTIEKLLIVIDLHSQTSQTSRYQ